jgi:hypothetical protein
MLDLETLGTSAGARVLTIGACRFDPYTGEIGSTFHSAIDDVDGRADTSTFKWWLNQSDASRRLLLKMLDSLDTYDCTALGVINAFNCFCEGHALDDRVKFLWSNGPAFDESILRELYRRYGMADMWPVRSSYSRCVRTVCALADAPRVEHANAHDALSDAIAQAKRVAEAYKLLGLSPR